MELRGVSAMVTGGASGLGAATARRLAARGARVVIADLNDELGAEVAKEIGGAYVRTDVTSEADVIGCVDEAAGATEPFRVLVNCAGIAKPARTVGRGATYDAAQRLDAFRRIIEVNLIGTFNCIRLAAVAMSRAPELDGGGRGAIVNTASVAAYDGQVGQASYSASKAGIVGMTLPVARDLAAIGVRVNTIVPGLFETPIYDVVDDPATFKETLKRDVLFPKRLGTPDEFATLAVEMLANDYLNAECIRIDGGARLRAK